MTSLLENLIPILSSVIATAMVLAFWGMLLTSVVRLVKRWLPSVGAEALELRLARPRLPDADSVPELPLADAALARVPVLMILPLLGASAADGAIGLAVSRLAIRRLMLRADLSVRGPEDTPAAGLASMEQLPPALREPQHVLGGSLRRDGASFVASLWLSVPDGTAQAVTLSTATLPELLDQLTATAARWLGSSHPGEQPHLRVLQSVTPASEAGFIAIGDALLEVERSDDDLEADEVLLTALDRGGTELSLLASHLSRYQLHHKIRTHEAAPCDAQLCYSIASDLWQAMGELDAARAYLRAALELSPCHARANAVAFRMAKQAGLHGERSALGYALAPGSAFTAHQRALYLMRHGDHDATTIDVAGRLVAIEPSDPVGLWALASAYERSGDTARALESAQRLLRWLDPLDPRTERFLNADRELMDRMDGGWSLADDTRAQIERLSSPPKSAAAASETGPSPPAI